MTTQARELAGIISNAGDLNFSDDITLGSDGAVLNFGADSDVTITHVADTGLILNSTRQLQFGDSGTYINQSADGVLNLTSDTEVEINATTVDINANVDISGNIVLGGTITVGDADTDNMIINANVNSHIIPNTDDTYDLGSTGQQWRNLYIDGTVEADAITIGGVTLSETIADTVGAMTTSNTESGITVTYDDGDNTLDFTVGTLNQDTTGTASLFTASANNSTDETVYPVFVDGATGSQGAETDTGLTYNPSTGMLTSTGVTATFTGNITGNVTGNTSGTAATVTTAAQTAITSVGTLTGLTGGTGDLIWDSPTFVVDSSAGKVGIGTTTPGSSHAKANLLVVGSGAAGGIGLYNGANDGGYYFSRDNANNTDAYDGGMSYDGSRNLKFHTNAGSTRMTINGSGNVGIGTASPAEILHIKDSTNTTLNIEGDSSAGSTFINFTAGSNATKAQISGAKSGASGGRLLFYTANSSGTSTERMRIDTSGNVSVGYNHSVSYPSDANFMVSNAATNGMEFSVEAISGENRILNYNRTSSTYQKMTTVASEHKFAIGATERMRIGSAGQIGIGGANYGTDGQVLTSTGASSAPAWEAAAGGVAFRAYLGSSLSVSAGTHTFAGSSHLTQEFDVGSCYNGSTGKFTAPQAGTYHFSATITMGATTTAVEYLSAEIVATPSGGSGTRYVVGGWNSKPSGDNAYASSGGSVTIQLAANEVVTLGYEISDAITLQGGIGHCSFSGFLVA